MIVNKLTKKYLYLGEMKNTSFSILTLYLIILRLDKSPIKKVKKTQLKHSIM